MKLPAIGSTTDVPAALGYHGVTDADAREGRPAPLPSAGPTQSEEQSRAYVDALRRAHAPW